jgi:hypothetical protein
VNAVSLCVAGLETTRQDSVVKLVASVCILSSPWWVYNLFFPFSTGFGIENKPLAILPILTLVVLLQLGLIQWMSAGNRFMSEVMLVGFLLKLAAVSLFQYIIGPFYQGDADVVGYFGHARAIVENFSLTGNWTFLHPITNTNFVIMVTSWLMFLFGPTFQGLMIVFASLSFWGQYLFYRAFCIAFPNGRRRAAALFMFFLPSIVFWPASIGKEALIFFFIGACCYWFAKLTETNNPAAFVATLFSLGGVMLVRPHIASMLVISLAGAYLLSKNLHGILGISAKSLGVPLLLLASLYLIAQARTFVDLKDVQQTQKVMKRVGDANYIGGSAFGDSYTYRLAAAPFLLFRPFPWEARSLQAAIAAIEGFCLMLFLWRQRGVLRSSFMSCRQKAFILFLWVFTVEFLLVFAGSMTNFGLLARQRIMLIPIALMIGLSQRLPCIGYITHPDPQSL